MTMTQNIPVNPPRRKKWRVLEWPSQSPDFNPIEMLQGDLKQAVPARNPSNNRKNFLPVDVRDWETVIGNV